MKQSFLALVLIIWGSTHAQEINFNYSALSINDSLKKDANAVYRLDDIELDVVSSSHYVEKVHEIITILKPEGAHHLKLNWGSNKFYKYNNVDIKVYNSPGIEMKRYKKKDFEVSSAYDGFSLATDEKVMRLIAAAPEYPCTIDLSYELE